MVAWWVQWREPLWSGRWLYNSGYRHSSRSGSSPHTRSTLWEYSVQASLERPSSLTQNWCGTWYLKTSWIYETQIDLLVYITVCTCIYIQLLLNDIFYLCTSMCLYSVHGVWKSVMHKSSILFTHILLLLKSFMHFTDTCYISHRWFTYPLRLMYSMQLCSV